MRRVTHQRWIAAACSLLTLGTAQTASALDKYLDLEPPQTKSGPGYGYNSISREFVLKQCVQFAPGVLEGGSGASGDDFKFSSIISNSQLADEMDLSVATKFSASMGVASASTSSKVDFFQSTKTNFLTHTILASYAEVEPMKYIAGDLNLKPEYLALVGTPAFRQQCGDYVIIGEQQGRWFFGTVQLVVKDTVTESKLAANGTVDAQYATIAAEVGLSTVNKLKQASSSQDLAIRVTSSGTNSASLTIDQFLAQVNSFPNANGPKNTYKLKAVPFESIVANWPISDPLAPLTSEQKLTKVAEAAWGLTSLIADSDFVTQNSKLFALGTTPQKRDARINHIKARRNFYQSQLDSMRSQAKSCDVDWNSTPACESLYNKWKEFAAFAVAEYEQFPVRYTADCYATRDAGDSIQAALLNRLPQERGQFSNTKGDREVGGGPVYFSARLDLKPDFTGGDPLGVRKLLATLKIHVEENKDDHTTFESSIKVPAYNLDMPGGSPVPLTQCAFRGDYGVKASLVNPSTAGCDPLKSVSNQAYQSCKDAVAADKHHGLLSGKTGEDPRTETFNKNALGVINSMRCSVDSDMSNDTPAIGCEAIDVRTVQLDLVNTQDAAADKWTKPPQNDQVATPKGIVASAALATILKQRFTSAATPITPNMTKRGTPQIRVCKPGLVAVDGECVLKLRR